MANKQLTIPELEVQARGIRRLIIQMLAQAGSGHPGGSLSAADLITALYSNVLRFNPADLQWPDRDRFHMSKGHACPLWYAVLAQSGYFEKEKLFTLRKFGSILQGHPDRKTPGVESASGSLGQGLSIALGMSLAARVDKKDYRVYCLLGDGEVQEGSVWEAAMACAHFSCSNLCAILDFNGCQIDGRCEDIMGLEPLAAKWQAFGWQVIQINGHNMQEILDAYDQAKMNKDKPSIIIARTVKGKGVSFMEGVVGFHGRAPTPDEAQRALKELS